MESTGPWLRWISRLKPPTAIVWKSLPSKIGNIIMVIHIISSIFTTLLFKIQMYPHIHRGSVPGSPADNVNSQILGVHFKRVKKVNKEAKNSFACHCTVKPLQFVGSRQSFELTVVSSWLHESSAQICIKMHCLATFGGRALWDQEEAAGNTEDCKVSSKHSGLLCSNTQSLFCVFFLCHPGVYKVVLCYPWNCG